MRYFSKFQATAKYYLAFFFGVIIGLSSYGQSVYDSTSSAEAQFFTKDGKKLRHKKAYKTARKYDIVLFGELHNNALNHLLQMELAQYLYQKEGKLHIGAEMIESDNQVLLDEYLYGIIDSSTFHKEARLWPNYASDYRPFVEFAKKHNLNFVATNIPRRYAKAVYRNGLSALDNLPEMSKNFIVPLPVEVDSTTPGYSQLLHMNMGHGTGFNGQNFMESQAIKDATMAYFILKNIEEGTPFLHINGNYHSQEYGGIYWWLKKARPDLNILVISAVETDKLNEEQLNSGDIIIQLPKGKFHSY